MSGAERGGGDTLDARLRKGVDITGGVSSEDYVLAVRRGEPMPIRGRGWKVREHQLGLCFSIVDCYGAVVATGLTLTDATDIVRWSSENSDAE